MSPCPIHACVNQHCSINFCLKGIALGNICTSLPAIGQTYKKKEKYIYNIYGLNIILYTPSTPALNLSFPWGQEFKKKLGYLKQIKGRDYGYANTLSLDSAGSLRPIDSSWGHLHGHDWTGKGQVMGWPPPVVKLCVHRLVHLHGF